MFAATPFACARASLRRRGVLLIAAWLLAGASAASAGEKPARPAPPGAGPRFVPSLSWRERLTLEPPDTGANVFNVVALAPDGTVAVTAEEGGTVRLWDAVTGKQRAAQRGGEKIWALRFTADGKAALVAGAAAVQWRDAGTGKEIRAARWELPRARALALAPDGDGAAIGYADGRVELRRFGTSPEKVDFQAHKSKVSALAFSADGKALATGDGDGNVKVWAVATRKELASLRPRGGGQVQSLAFTLDGKTVVSAHGRGGVHLWGLPAGTERPPLRGQALTFLCVAASPDGRTLAAGTANGAVRIWDLTANRIVHTFKAHTGQVRGLAFAADGKTLGSASSDGTAKVWRPEGPVAEAPPEPKVAARDMESRLKELRSADPVRALAAVQALAATPRQTLVVLKKVLRPIEPMAAERAARLLADLDNGRYAIREKAYRELETCGDSARAALKTALTSNRALEVQRRLLKLVERLDKQETPEFAFQRRAVEVLERIAAREARAFLQELTTGVPDAHLTRYAQDALQRLDE